MNESKVMDYRGYSVYRVTDADQDDFEIWKNGKKIMSCETESEAREWIDDQENIKEQIIMSAQKLQVIRELEEGKSARSALMLEADDLGARRVDFLSALTAFVGAWMSVLEAYENLEDVDPTFPDLFAEEYPFDKSFDDLALDVSNWERHLSSAFVK